LMDNFFIFKKKKFKWKTLVIQGLKKET